jgi:hypothetical protein
MSSRELPYPLFDADNHLYETQEAFLRYLPKQYAGAIQYQLAEVYRKMPEAFPGDPVEEIRTRIHISPFWEDNLGAAAERFRRYPAVLYLGTNPRPASCCAASCRPSWRPPSGLRRSGVRTHKPLTTPDIRPRM